MTFSSDEHLNEKYSELCLAVGNLFITFGRLEGTLSAILRLHLANNFGEHLIENEDVQLSSAIYGSLRYSAIRDTMRRLAKVEKTPAEMNSFLDDIFSQISHIQDFRNKLAHQTIVPSNNPENFWQVSDRTVTRDLKNIKVFVFDTTAIIAAVEDLAKASNILGNREIKTTLFKQLHISPLAWRYKPSMLKREGLGSP